MNGEVKFNLEWSDAEVVSLAKMSVSINGDVIWPATFEGAFLEVFVDDVLLFLVENWHFLLLENTYPIIDPAKPSAFRYSVENRWSGNPLLDSEEESIRVEVYERHHNLATCFSGIYDLPPLWLVRSQEGMLIDNGNSVWEYPLTSVVDELERLAEIICERISKVDKCKELIAAWHNRASSRDQLSILAASVEVQRNSVEVLVNDEFLVLPDNLNDARK